MEDVEIFAESLHIDITWVILSLFLIFGIFGWVLLPFRIFNIVKDVFKEG